MSHGNTVFCKPLTDEIKSSLRNIAVQYKANTFKVPLDFGASTGASEASFLSLLPTRFMAGKPIFSIMTKFRAKITAATIKDQPYQAFIMTRTPMKRGKRN